MTWDQICRKVGRTEGGYECSNMCKVNMKSFSCFAGEKMEDYYAANGYSGKESA